MVNEMLVRLTVARIEAEPATFNMVHWFRRDDCGTTMCFAGHALAASGYNLDEIERIDLRSQVPVIAQRLLGLNYEQADGIFEYTDVHVGTEPGRMCNCGCGVMVNGRRVVRQVTLDDLKERITELTGITFDEEDAPIVVDALPMAA